MQSHRTVKQLSERAPEIFQEFIIYLEEHQGLNSGTIHNRKGPLLEFLRSHRWFKKSADARRLSLEMVQRYVRKKSPPLSVDNKKAMLTSLRTFFRFLYLKEYQSQDLTFSVPNIVVYTRARVPKALPLKLVKKLLNVPDRRRAIGRRDYAILLLFLKYGVRRKQVTDLFFERP